MNGNHRYVRLAQDENTFDIEEEFPQENRQFSFDRVSIFLLTIYLIILLSSIL